MVKAQRKHMNARGLLDSVLIAVTLIHIYIYIYTYITIIMQANSATSYMPKGYEMNKQLI